MSASSDSSASILRGSKRNSFLSYVYGDFDIQSEISMRFHLLVYLHSYRVREAGLLISQTCKCSNLGESKLAKIGIARQSLPAQVAVCSPAASKLCTVLRW